MLFERVISSRPLVLLDQRAACAGEGRGVTRGPRPPPTIPRNWLGPVTDGGVMSSDPDMFLVIEPTLEGFLGCVLDVREPPRLVAKTDSPLAWAEIWAWWRAVKERHGRPA
jgi:hypothetical protein